MQDSKHKEDTAPVVYNFQCVNCNMNEKANYKGIKPPFSRNIVLKYPSYVMKDPFSPPGTGEILVLGADCAMCNKSVCINKDCSLFYQKTYCLDCVNNSLDKFPAEVCNKISQLKRT